jgi:hypothetical protein
VFGFEIDTWDVATLGALAVIALAIAAAWPPFDDAPPRRRTVERRPS